MPSRDVEIDLVGRNRLSSATRSAANDLDKLARKVDQLERKLAKFEAGEIKVKADVDTNRFVAFGRRAGNAFSNAVGSAIADGSRAIGNAVRKMLIRGGPPIQIAMAAFAVRIAGFFGQAITAAFGLALGPALLAAPIAFLLKTQLDASKQVEKSEKRIAALKKRLEAAKTRDVQERLRKEIAAEQRILAENEKQAQSWDRLKGRAKSFMEVISAPLKLPLQKALDAIGDGLDRLKKPVRDIMASLGPALAPLTKGVMNSLLEFIKALEPAMPGIVAGMQTWALEMPKIGRAFGDMIAQIMANPDAVINAILSVSHALQEIAIFAGTFVSALTRIGNAFRAFMLANQQFVLGFIIQFDNFISALASIPGSPFAGLQANIHALRLKAEADFAASKAAYLDAQAAMARNKIVAKIEADIAGLETKIALAKIKLDTVKNKKTRAKIQADIAQMELKVSIANAKLTLLHKKKTKPKLQAAKEDLEAKVAAAKKRLKQVHDQKTRAKIQADIRAAESKLRTIKAQLDALDGKVATVTIRTLATRYETTRRRTITSMGGYAPNLPAAGDSWSSLSGAAGTHRTGGPLTIEAPTVNTRVFLDSKEIAAAVRSTVMDENRRSAHRARVGRRN